MADVQLRVGNEPGSKTSLPKVLIVDDEPEVQALCTRLLRNRYAVTCACSGDEALQILAGESHFAAALVDQSLPGNISGVDLLTRALELQASCGRILMTGYADPTHLGTAINTAQVHGFLQKPWKSEQFCQLVDEVIERVQRGARIAREHAELQCLAKDPRTGLPTRQTAQRQASEWMHQGGFLGVLAIDSSELWNGQLEFGRESFDLVTRRFVGLLGDMQGRCFRRQDVLVVDEEESPCFLIFLSNPRVDRVACAHDVAELAQRLQEQITRELFRQQLPLSGWWPTVAVGFGFRLYNPHLPDIYQVRQVVGEAKDSARRMLANDARVSRKSELQRIILGEHISSVFQPIVDLKNNAVLGYEALSRGPSATEYESPLFLLRVADRTGLTIELDRMFRSVALNNARGLPAGSKVFVNTLPATIYDPELQAARLSRTLERLAIIPSRVVFEFSERYVVTNQALLLDALREHRELGIQLAIDDVGAGYSGLERIASLQPDYLKIDESLVRHVETQGVKRSVLSALVRMAADIGAQVIAEGIESSDEMKCLLDLGVGYGQGFHIARPAPLPG